MKELSRETRLLLENIENKIDPQVEDDYLAQWDQFVHGKYNGDIFLANRSKKNNKKYETQQLNINDALIDYETMLVHQMTDVYNSLASDNFLTVRTNYGTGIMSSLFGAEVFTMPRELNTLPTTKPMGDLDKMEELLQKGIPNLMNGLGRNVFEMGEYFLEVFEQYPKIKKYVSVYHPDTQGPLDILELLWGSDLFYNFYDEPEVVHQMLKMVSETYIQFMEKWYKLYPPTKDWTNHWNHMAHLGQIVIRNDSAMNLSPEMYEEFAKPYDEMLLKHFNGGVIHFCGRGDHYIEKMSHIQNLYGVNISQPHLNDMEVIYKNTVDKGICILGFDHAHALQDVQRNNQFNHRLSSLGI